MCTTNSSVSLVNFCIRAGSDGLSDIGAPQKLNFPDNLSDFICVARMCQTMKDRDV